MSMDAHVYFCLGYKRSDISNKFWIKKLNLNPEEVEEYGIREFENEIEDFCRANNLETTIMSLDDNENLIGIIEEWSRNDYKLFGMELNQEEYQKLVTKLTNIFSFEPSIYLGVEYY